MSLLKQRPGFMEVIMWIDYNTLTLLFSMMVIVGLLADTGFFEYAAIKAYKIANGRPWKYDNTSQSLICQLLQMSMLTNYLFTNIILTGFWWCYAVLPA